MAARFKIKSKSLSIKEAVTPEEITSAECKSLCEKAGIEYLEGYESRCKQFKFTDSSLDSFNDVVIAKGVGFEKYKKNPVVLSFHNSHNFPIGATVSVWYSETEDAVKGIVLFYDYRVDPTGVSDTAFKMVDNGAVRACSIGFVPSKMHRMIKAEEKLYKVAEGTQGGFVFESCELAELSIVTLPANSSALKEPLTRKALLLEDLEVLRKANIYDGEEIDNLEEFVKELENPEIKEAIMAIKKASSEGKKIVINVGDSQEMKDLTNLIKKMQDGEVVSDYMRGFLESMKEHLVLTLKIIDDLLEGEEQSEESKPEEKPPAPAAEPPVGEEPVKAMGLLEDMDLYGALIKANKVLTQKQGV